MGYSLVSFSAGPAAFGTAATILLLLLVIVWFVTATAAAIKGGTVDGSSRFAQMYGYTVCLVAVILGITSLASIIDAAFDRAYPLQSEYSYGASLTSFEAYSATYARERNMMSPADAAAPDTASEATLRRRYDALVADRLATTKYRTSKRFVVHGVLFVTAVALFLVHWRWVRRTR